MRKYFGLLLFVVIGCTGAKTYPVTGKVTWEGAPLVDGDILFIPEDATLASEGGKIKDGAFAFPARLGKKKVQIRAAKIDPTKKGPKGEESYVDYIPEKYNDQSTLTAEVTEQQKDFTFDLTQK